MSHHHHCIGPCRSSRPPWRHVHFIGIGGVGMAGLAHILADWGCHVTGSDRTESLMTASLERRGLHLRIGHDAAALGQADAVVYSNAVPGDNPERLAAARKRIPTWLRGAFLAELARSFPTVVAVAGSHGKTTTSALIAHILTVTGCRPGYLVGGMVPGWERAARAGDGHILVTEVDESDGTQALIDSTIAVITNIDDDHAWSHGGVDALHRNFADFARRAARIVTDDAPAIHAILQDHPDIRVVGTAGDTSIRESLSVPGEHNVCNARLALAACVLLGVDRDEAVASLASFPGVDRRLSLRYRGLRGRTLVVEDYAHHPVELAASIAAMRESWPKHALRVVFQPHRFERVRHYGKRFAEILSTANEVHVVRPFAAWLQDGEATDPRAIAQGVEHCPARYWDNHLDRLVADLSITAGKHRHDLVAVIGAGDVHDLVQPLVNAVRTRERHELITRLQDLNVAIDETRTWAQLTTLGVGSARPLRVLPETPEALQAVLQAAGREQVDVAVIGAGSDLVGTDHEPLRLVVCLTKGDFVGIRPGRGEAVVGAGVCLYPLARALARAGCCPVALASLAWIPGSIGGALKLNAGASGYCIGELVSWIEGVCLDGAPWRASAADISWDYRRGSIPHDVVITRAAIRLPSEGACCSLESIEEQGRMRRLRQPAGRSAGCIFRNPPGRGAGELLDAAGCKGMRCGSLVVSDRHANFVLNEAPLESEEAMRQLVCRCRERVRQRFGVDLEDEVLWAGDPRLR